MSSEKLTGNLGTASDLSSLYRRVKKNCCSGWEKNPKEFYTWYEKQYAEQQGLCIYCRLPGDTRRHYGKWFREGRRGKRLEVDRIESKEPYSPENCVLACYPCNNAKSDVFSYAEFLEIGKAINMVKKGLKV
ncbi:HNH endonuclease [Chloroflexota bacterium]